MTKCVTIKLVFSEGHRIPPIDQATPLFSIDSSMKFEAIAPVEHVNESPNAPTTEMSTRNTQINYDGRKKSSISKL